MERNEIIERLNAGIVKFKFNKVDGVERIANGTRNYDILLENKAVPNGSKIENDEIVTYFDIDKKSWRSFRTENFIEFI